MRLFVVSRGSRLWIVATAAVTLFGGTGSGSPADDASSNSGSGIEKRSALRQSPLVRTPWIVVALVLVAVVGTTGCGGSASVKSRITRFVGTSATRCKDTTQVRRGLVIYNCGFETGEEGCFTVGKVVTQWYGGSSCPDMLGSIVAHPPLPALASGKDPGDFSRRDIALYNDAFNECKNMEPSDWSNVYKVTSTNANTRATRYAEESQAVAETAYGASGKAHDVRFQGCLDALTQ